MTAELSLLEQAIAEAGGPEVFAEMMAKLPADEVERLARDWPLNARPSQLPPPGDWSTWAVIAGRGFGKTRTGAEFIHAEVEAGRAGRVALVAPTAKDARDAIIEGESGIMATARLGNQPTYEPSKSRLTWPNGARGFVFTAEEPDSFRNKQHHLAWLDEACAYADPQAVWDQCQFTLRLGPNPRALLTSTPRPTPWLRALLKDPSVHVTRGRTDDNRTLTPRYLEGLNKYRGTRLGRQEIEGELIEENPGALWRLADIDRARLRHAPDLQRIAIGVDPAVSTNKNSDETGIIVAGIGNCHCRETIERHAFVLADYSGTHSPAAWAQAVRSAYVRHQADRIIAEVNQGGQLVAANLRANGAENLPLKTVHASRGKAVRAEPISALYEQGKVHHVGSLAALEDQMCQWDPLSDATSPDRVDALVYVLSELMVDSIGADFSEAFRARAALGPLLARRR